MSTNDMLYDIYFSGQAMEGADLATVKSNIAKLFKADAAKTNMLFSGKLCLIKQGVDKTTAAKYKNIFKSAGAVALITEHGAANKAKAAAPGKKPSQPEPATPSAKPETTNSQPAESPAQAKQPAAPATEMTQTVAKETEAATEKPIAKPTAEPKAEPVKKKMTMAERIAQMEAEDAAKAATPCSTTTGIAAAAAAATTLAASSNDTANVTTKVDTESANATVEISTGTLSSDDLLPAGSAVLTDEERPVVEAVDVNTNHLHAEASNDEYLVEPTPFEEADVDISHLDVADVGTLPNLDIPDAPEVAIPTFDISDAGADILDERKEFIPKDVDTSGLTLS